jgi:hypothetical protein
VGLLGALRPAGIVTLELDHSPPVQTALTIADVLQQGFPHRGVPLDVRRWRIRNLPHLWRGLCRHQAARMLNLVHCSGQLHLDIIYPNGDCQSLGLVSLRVVTTAAVNAMVDAFQGSFTLSDFKFHGLGTGGSAEAVGDTALVTELTTQYNTDNTRATGSQTEGATANIYRTVATNTLDEGATIVEHGILNQAATGGGTLLDRSVFAAVVVSASLGLKSTYDLTIAAGG